MAKLYLICGKICSGKSYYARQLQKEIQAISLSCDELMLSLFPEGLGEKHDAFSKIARDYLMKKALEAVQAGCNVILDWGFWWADNRKAVSDQARAAGCDFEWHYVDVSDERWEKNILERNEKILRGETKDYFLDEGLKQKCLSLFDVPKREEMDRWIVKD
ncbi:MAG: ATP-binding protein [Clostridia bacterium]|nr:ATP-binding protein [Clostridia bacterium]